MPNASGKYSKAISDRSGLAFPYKEMIKEWNGSLVHKSEFEAKHPQEEPTIHKVDGEALANSRPSRSEPIVVPVGSRTFFDQNDTMSPQTQNPILMTMNINSVTVSIS
tara:strand:- start:122 stop:445 length:324 start_codon:yes stop_codon:yes gene_type:complete